MAKGGDANRYGQILERVAKTRIVVYGWIHNSYKLVRELGRAEARDPANWTRKPIRGATHIQKEPAPADGYNPLPQLKV